MATITGTYNGTARFTRGGAGKFIDFSSRVGLCVPKQCTADDLQRIKGPELTQMALKAGWINVSVDFFLS